jgi:hypothetical protein
MSKLKTDVRLDRENYGKKNKDGAREKSKHAARWGSELL